jgi:tetratricopeptide (TPR) repeat protein
MNRTTDDTMMCNNDSVIGLNILITKSQSKSEYASLHNNLHSIDPQKSSVADTNRMGVLHFQRGHIPVSQLHFLTALKNIQALKNPSLSIRDFAVSLSSSLQSVKEEVSSWTYDSTRKRPRPSIESHTSCSHACDEGLHEILEVILFSDDADFDSMSATLHYNIAQTHLALKDYQEAIGWFHKALAQHQYDTLNVSLIKYKVLHNLGYCAYQLEDYQVAIDCFHRACEALSMSGLADDYIAASTYSCIGVLFFNLATPDTESALRAFKKSFEIYQSNPTTCTNSEMATLLNNFGRVFYLKGEFERAIGFYQQALAIRCQELGDNAIDVAATRYNLGNAYHKTQDLRHAMSCYDEFIRIAEECLGLKTREVAFVYKCKAEILQEINDVDSALKHYNKALLLTKAALGDGHREVGCILNKAGNLCFEQGKYQEALRYYLWGLEIENNHPNRDQNLILVTLTNIAQTHKHLGRIELALAFYREVYTVQTKVKKADTLEIASTLSSIGLMLYHLKHYEEAFETYQEALRIRRDYYGTDENTDVASSLNAIGLVLFKQGMYELCMHCFNECLEIRRNILGPDHSELAMVWYNLASVYFETGDDEAALKLYDEALRIERATLGDHHPDIVLTMIHLGQVKQQCGLLEDAITVFEEAIRIHCLQKREDGLREARIHNFMGNCYLQKGDVSNMMKALAASSRVLMSLGRADEPLAIKGYNLYGLAKLHPEAAPMA